MQRRHAEHLPGGAGGWGRVQTPKLLSARWGWGGSRGDTFQCCDNGMVTPAPYVAC